MNLAYTTTSLALLTLLGACASPNTATSKGELRMEPLLRIGATPPSPEEAFAAGRRALDEHRPGTALAWFDLMLSAQPNSARALNGRAVALARLGRLDSAVQTLEKALRVEPQLAYLHANLGRVLIQAGDLERALVSMQSALQQVPDDKQLESEVNALQLRLRTARATAQPSASPDSQGKAIAASLPPTTLPSGLAPASERTVPLISPPDRGSPLSEPRVASWVQVGPQQFELRPGTLPSTRFAVEREAVTTAPMIPEMIGLEISNGAGEFGLARRMARRLTELGTPVGRITNHRHFHVKLTKVEFRPGQQAAASAVARSLGMPVEMVATEKLGPSVSVRILLGQDARSTIVAAK